MDQHLAGNGRPQSSEPPVRPPQGDQVVVGDIPREPPGFRLRADPLAELDRAGPDKPQTPVVHAVTGTPGAGATQLAAGYARARLAEGWRLVAWVNAGDAASLLADLATVAEAAGLCDGGTGQDAAAAALAVRHQLEADGHRCLIVFDNASDPGVPRPFVPDAGAARVLITGSKQSVADLGTAVQVDVFTPDEAVAFLAERTGLADADRAAAVAAQLGYLPLALAQASAVIAAKHLKYEMYLERLRALQAEARQAVALGEPYPRGLAEAVLLSLDAVRADDQSGVCTRVMEIVAVLSAAGVRRALLHAAGQAGVLVSGRDRLTKELVDRALAQLAGRSLLSFSLDGQTIITHRLVMQVVRDRLTRRGRLTAVCRAAAFVLDACGAAVAGSPDRPAVRDIPKQVAALLQNIAEPAGKADDELAELLLRIRFWALQCLNRLGDSALQAIAVGEPLIADFDRVLGSSDPDTLDARNSLAIAYQDAGRIAEAVALHEQTLAAFERARGRNHPSTLASRNNLAEAYRAAGRVQDAVALHEQTLAAYERVRGPGHPDTLTSRSHLARAYRAAGRVEDAVALLEQVLATRERVLGPDHLSTLGSRSNLANAYRAAGRVDEAVTLHEQALAGYERVRGPDHLSTLGSRNNLANAYRVAGRVDEAITLHEQVLAVRLGVLGPGHPDTVQSQNNLARAHQDAERPR